MRVNSHLFKFLPVFITLTGAPFTSFAAQSDSDIKKAIIAESIASYPSPCACPYSTARNGSSCGRRSAYSKPGGYAPICYPTDISSQMIENRRQHLNR